MKQMEQTAHRLADEAGKILQKWFRNPTIAIEVKSDKTFVCQADIESEEKMRSIILNVFPDHGILGEESAPHNANAEWVWVLDPLDGTGAFLDGIPLFGVLVALYHKGEPVFGLVDMPILKERWWSDGKTTFFNGNPCSTLNTATKIQDVTVYASSPHMFLGSRQPQFENLRKHCSKGCYGLHCYAYGLLASGNIDLVAEADMKVFDYAPMAPIIKGAGGMATNWDGKPLGLNSGDTILAAASANLHAQALKCL